MKLTTGVVTLAMMMGTGWAQTPAVNPSTTNPAQQAQQKPAAATAAKPAAATSTKPAAPAPAPKVAAAPVKPAPAPAKTASAKPVAKKAPVAKPVAAATSAPAKDKAEPSADAQSSSDSEDKKYSMNGKRDPFISPVVSRQSGSGCSTGKKCLDIEAIAVRGVVRSDAGMIAVVTNGLNKAYFLRENDPVFNGYVVKITGDSVVFKETFQDKLGKPFTKDVVKKLTTPAV